MPKHSASVQPIIDVLLVSICHLQSSFESRHMTLQSLQMIAAISGPPLLTEAPVVTPDSIHLFLLCDLSFSSVVPFRPFCCFHH